MRANYIAATLQNLVVRTGRFIVVLALLVSIGAHWAVMQSFAWTQMIVERSGASSFSEAVKTTFDGDHPCAICQRIAEETQKEKQQEQVQLKVKPDLVLELKAIAFHAPSSEAVSLPAHFTAERRSERPPLPPPRRA